MSAKNKLVNKRTRRELRENKTTRLAESTPSTDIPLDVSSAVLVSEKEKLSRAARQNWHRSRDKVLTVVRKAAKTDSEVQARRLKLMPLAKLIRRRFQAGRRAATADYLQRKLSENSKFRAPLLQEIQKQINRLAVIQTECVSRIH